MNLAKQRVTVEPSGMAQAWGHLFFRISVGIMIFYIHGWHKLEGWIVYLQHGTSWKLAEEVAGMHFPAPLPLAVAATLVQFVSSLFVIIGWFTRLNSALLAGVLGGAILQNLMANRDPQLAVLYTLVVLTLVFMGGGEFSFDARRWRKTQQRSL